MMKGVKARSPVPAARGATPQQCVRPGGRDGTNMKQYGVDVSHHQQPSALPWAKFAESSSFCIVRSSYGTMRDRVTVDHVKHARAAGLRVGCYHFFRPSQDPSDQLAIFRSQLELAGITTGDIVPALDIEADPLPAPGLAVAPIWQAGVRFLLEHLVDQYGDALVYITQREFGMLGSPTWLLERPLWIAHYTGAAKPATPANHPATIWQHRVGPYDPDGPGGYDKAHPLLDQNRLLGTLPLIGAHEPIVNSTLPPTPAFNETPDDGLEELLASVEGDAWQRAQDAVGQAGANLREYESDTDPSDLAPESKA
jgi:GH25 family lysozyme M1 (1,4-beta-N-acetylmuramidase)